MEQNQAYTFDEAPLIVAENLVMEYRLSPTEFVRALDGVSLNVWRREFISIFGPEGSGKSTLLQLLGCLDRPTEGTLSIDGETVTDLPTNRLAGIRAEKIGFIFQSHHLVSTLTAIENVMLPLRHRKMPHAQAEQVAGIWLVRVGLENRMYHRPSELSPSEQRRVALARTLVTEPLIIMADEPTGELDAEAAQDLLELMGGLNYEFGQTYVVATEHEEIAHMCDRIVQLAAGRITSDVNLVAVGETADEQPVDNAETDTDADTSPQASPGDTHA